MTTLDFDKNRVKFSKIYQNYPNIDKKWAKCLQKFNRTNQYRLNSLEICHNIQKVDKKWQKLNFNDRKSTTGYKNGEKSTKHRLLWKKSTKVTQYSYKINKSEKRYRPKRNKTRPKLTEMDITWKNSSKIYQNWTKLQKSYIEIDKIRLQWTK